jgi:hypothetical protein
MDDKPPHDSMTEEKIDQSLDENAIASSTAIEPYGPSGMIPW